VLKILRQRGPVIGDTHVAADIGCSTFSTQAPFNVGNSVLGYGMGLSSSMLERHRGRPRLRRLAAAGLCPSFLRGQGAHESDPVDAARKPRARGGHLPARNRRSVTAAPLLSLLIPAVGGQGGGVLLEWIVDAALVEGYPVHGTSIPRGRSDIHHRPT
jgi:hypothetical protein